MYTMIKKNRIIQIIIILIFLSACNIKLAPPGKQTVAGSGPAEGNPAVPNTSSHLSIEQTANNKQDFDFLMPKKYNKKKNFEKYYNKNKYKIESKISELIKNYKNNEEEKNIIMKIIKSDIFSNLKFGFRKIKSDRIDLKKLLEIMNKKEDKQFVYDYIEKYKNKKHINTLFYYVKTLKNDSYDILQALLKNDLVKNNFEDFKDEIKSILLHIDTTYIAGGIYTDLKTFQQGIENFEYKKNILNLVKIHYPNYF